MLLQRYSFSLARTAMAGLALAFLAGCAKDPLQVDRNRPPTTYIVAAPGSAISRDTTTASYRVHLYWRGEDPDGYVVGFLWAFDDSSISNFRFTTKTDSIFELAVNDSEAITSGSTLLSLSRIHTFYVRAVDNLGKADPGIAFWNRRLFRAATLAPSVRFVGDYPSGAGIDTLPDGGPFRVCWTGNDSDGVVLRYKFDVGSYSSPLTTDTCAFFNDAANPASVALGSGLYSMTVTAVDNAYAVGKTNFFFVVNHDPETWFEPKTGPRGYYIAPYIGGELRNQMDDFGEGDTIPYRSTVWFNWDGEDVKGGEANILTGWALNLRAGTRNGGEPYTIGYLDQLSAGPPPIRFKTNSPETLRPLGFHNLVLDSLDAGYNMIMLVASRDASSRGDGTPASFRFNCNRRPSIDSLWVEETAQFTENGLEVGRLISWISTDYEDGIAREARITLDGLNTLTVGEFAQSTFIPDRVFLALAPSNPHSVRVRVKDRAEIESDNFLTVYFDIPTTTSQATPRVKE